MPTASNSLRRMGLRHNIVVNTKLRAADLRQVIRQSLVSWFKDDAPSMLWQVLRARLLSFGLVLGIGFLLLVSLIASAALEGLGSWVGTLVAEWHGVVLTLDLLLAFAMATILFAMIFKYVPREEIAWGDVWVGALVTALLFTAGKWVIIVYLGRVAFASAYGVAGSFLVLLLWVYYSAQIFLLGAEFTRNFAYEHGSRGAHADQHPGDAAGAEPV
jgi:membrane protein